MGVTLNSVTIADMFLSDKNNSLMDRMIDLAVSREDFKFRALSAENTLLLVSDALADPTCTTQDIAFLLMP